MPTVLLLMPIPANLSAVRSENCSESISFFAPKKLTTKFFDSAIASWLPVVFSMHTRISGGSRDAEQNADTVIPCKAPDESIDVTTVIPLGKRDMAARNSSGVTGIRMKIYRLGRYCASTMKTGQVRVLKNRF